MIVSLKWMHARTLETSGTTAHTRRSWRNPSLAWARLPWWSAVCFSVAVCACSSDSGSEPPPPIEPEPRVPRGLEKVSGLRNAAMAIENRPASCRITRAIVIVDGKPTPRKLRARSGVCLYWGNKSSGRVRVEQLPAPGVRLQAPADWFVMPAGTVNGRGPFETLTPREFRQVLRDEGGKFGCTTIRSESHYGARYYGSTGHPVRIPFRTHPGGGRVELRIEPSPEREALAGDVRAVRRLRCGRRAVDARPVRCRRPRAVTIVNGKPLPAELRIRRRTDCVVWGNRGKRQVTIDSERCPRCFFTLPLPPRSAGVNYFGAAAPKRFPHPIRYGIKPGGTSGTILLEDD